MKHLKYLCTLFKPADQSKYIGVSALVQKFDGVLCFSFTNRLATVQRTLLAKLKDQKRQWCCFVLLSNTQSCQVKMSTYTIECRPSSNGQSTGLLSTHQGDHRPPDQLRRLPSCTIVWTQLTAVWKSFGQSASAPSGLSSNAWHLSQPELRSTSCMGPGPAPAATRSKWRDTERITGWQTCW